MKPIRASDIGTYLYCRRAWWHRIHGHESINQTEMALGTELHRQHGRQILAASLMRALREAGADPDTVSFTGDGAQAWIAP